MSASQGAPSSGRVRKHVSIRRALAAFLVAAGGLAMPGTARAAVFVVNTASDAAADAGCTAADCTLREAIAAANADATPDVVSFNIPGAGPHTITIGTALPQITRPVTIDATTEPDFAGTPVVQILDGASIVRAIDVSSANAAGTVVRGLAIGGFTHAVRVAANDVVVAGNWLGVSPSATATANTNGVFLDAGARTIVGGPAVADRNVISANTSFGIRIDDPAGGHRFEGNFIGTSPDGASAFGNGNSGISWNGAAGNVVVKNNLISANGFTSSPAGDGINMDGGGHVITGNLIGTDASGMTDLGNASNGITQAGGPGGAPLRIGGPAPTDRNVISGNGAAGIDILLPALADQSNPHVIEGNYVGTNAAGTAAVANDGAGLELAGARNVRVIANVVSGNTGIGIDLQSVGAPVSPTPTQAGTGGVIVQRNFVGTDPTGANPIGNGGIGIHLHGVLDALVGGEGLGNVVSANGRDGIRMARPNGADGGHRNLVSFNRVGAALGGSAALGNNFGVTVHNGADDNVIEHNTITRNREDGVALGLELSNSLEGGNLRNDIRRNVITDNGKLGIDILNNGEVLPNDAGDGDVGANLRQNYPVVTNASAAGTSGAVQGTLNSTANTTFRIDVYANAACDASGHGEGFQHVVTFSVTTDASGNASFTQAFTAVGGLSVLTSTATDPTGNTSEFSGCRAVDTPTVNDPPAASDDTVTVPQDSAATLISVLANDSDPDGDALTVMGVGTPVSGTAAVLEDGSGVRYQPNAGFSGSDSFTYTISDGKGGTDTATVFVTVEASTPTPTASLLVTKTELFRGQRQPRNAHGRWTFTLTGSNGFSDTQKTNSNGNTHQILWSGLTPGEYTLCEQPFANWRSSLGSDRCETLNLAAGAEHGLTVRNTCSQSASRATTPGQRTRR